MTLDTSGIIGQSPALQEVFAILGKVAPTDSTVLVSGESGTGKELMVRALHRNSKRTGAPFVPVNCGAIPGELLESELFGHEKGAFTHAIRTRAGRFELADGGTVFLDEIGEMDLSLQVKILRVLQEREFERVGGTKTYKANVRIIAATNRDLEQEVAKGNFREDLFYRLNVIPIHLPPLRERQEDIPLLAHYFLQKFCKHQNRCLMRLAEETQNILLSYSWPGNVRELENFMERLSILCDGDVITPMDLPDKILKETGTKVSPPPKVQTRPMVQGFRFPAVRDMQEQGVGLKDFFDIMETHLLKEALYMADGVKNQAAEILGIKRTTLIEKLKKKKITS
ncbi:sigma-54 interaction domain-containing protein [Desulfoplanes formicivorans]|uniref:Fis family transcriptional regulator n=1 Tax=Desulfoplanes formicivorans TaxID=1592317 RepID=A0A194AF44_9BACT|nr:sigma-54 dependent transcriptional regulator [Desulfoplanes formicivorans]GAU07953.1 Fis family transcriptional regulator [Desulfoplanes formicivorans]